MPASEPVDKRLLRKRVVDADTGCWNFDGCRMRTGYGVIALHNRPRLAHRVSYSVFIGDIPEGMNVLHRCDNRGCFNPDHLFLGTQRDNVIDMYNKGRGIVTPKDALGRFYARPQARY